LSPFSGQRGTAPFGYTRPRRCTGIEGFGSVVLRCLPDLPRPAFAENDNASEVLFEPGRCRFRMEPTGPRRCRAIIIGGLPLQRPPLRTNVEISALPGRGPVQLVWRRSRRLRCAALRGLSGAANILGYNSQNETREAMAIPRPAQSASDN